MRRPNLRKPKAAVVIIEAEQDRLDREHAERKSGKAARANRRPVREVGRWIGPTTARERAESEARTRNITADPLRRVIRAAARRAAEIENPTLVPGKCNAMLRPRRGARRCTKDPVWGGRRCQFHPGIVLPGEESLS